MEVRMLIGGDAGKVLDVHPFYARRLIAKGDAVDMNQPQAVEVLPEVIQPVVRASVPAGALGVLAAAQHSTRRRGVR
jgi:hypothetical protein